MSSNTPDSEALIVPPTIKAVIDHFEARTDLYTADNVHSALCDARKALKDPTPAENHGAWAEVLAFGLTERSHNEKPWGTYFGPTGSGTNADGETVYFPDIADADWAVLDLWVKRAQSVKSPVLLARYADLVWDLSQVIASRQRQVEFARSAIDAYLVIVTQQDRDLYDRFPWVERALSLAIQIRDTKRRDRARKALLALHREAVTGNSWWWKAFGIFERQQKSGVTDEEVAEIISDIEAVLARVSDTSSPEQFDPHATESAANKLIKYYRRQNKTDEVKRLQATIGRAFEHFGTMADALVAASVLPTSLEAYQQAGLKDDAKRILGLIETANADSIKLMTKVETKHEISRAEIDKFCSDIVGDTTEQAFVQIALQFMLKEDATQESLKETTKAAPLSAIFPKTVVQKDRVTAHIGSLEDDPMGHLISHAAQNVSLLSPWLGWALDHAKSTYGLTSEDLTLWANRTGLFGDGRLLHEGVAAWMSDDHIKALHILIPQIEFAFRSLLRGLGRTTTKAHPQMQQARMVITMGELLFNKETAETLGPRGQDLVLHFRTLFTDPRGMNLRNMMAHGELSIDAMHGAQTNWLVHAALLLGAWLKPRKSETE